MYNDNNKKRQAEILKECIELQKDVNDYTTKIDRDIFDINIALLGNDMALMQECAIHIKIKYPNFTQALPYNVSLLLPYSIAIEDMTYEQLCHVLITERDALQNLKSEYGLSQGIKRGLELAAKWNAEDKNM